MHTLPQLLEMIRRFDADNPFPDAPEALYEPCRYMLGLGGKRLRPAMLLMGYELFATGVEAALPAAWAVELFHNFTLMHDDIMDEAPLRRGHQTVHTKWNLTTGVLSGDVMLIQAYRHLNSVTNKAIIPDLLTIFNRVAIEVCEGQQYDVNFETRSDVSLAEYIRMIELKTAVLLGGALEMGAVCALAPREDAVLLRDFGRLAGIAFQIQDDLLDTYGDPAKFGKQVGGDILQNKKTFLVLKTLETASDADKKALLDWMKPNPGVNPEEKVGAVRALFDRNDIPALVSAAMLEFQTEAFRHLADVKVSDDHKVVLRKMVDDLLIRDF
jgi:geranylgeranyl diphosphate synthase type II